MLRPRAVWSGPAITGQGEPDGETYAHYQATQEAAEIIEMLQAGTAPHVSQDYTEAE